MIGVELTRNVPVATAVVIAIVRNTIVLPSQATLRIRASKRFGLAPSIRHHSLWFRARKPIDRRNSRTPVALPQARVHQASGGGIYSEELQDEDFSHACVCNLAHRRHERRAGPIQSGPD